MNITDVERLFLDKTFPFVGAYTDDGLVGIGEGIRRQPVIVKTIGKEILKPTISTVAHLHFCAAYSIVPHAQ